MMATWNILLTTVLALLIWLCSLTVWAIDCFNCYSTDGNTRDCEDQFGPHNKTGHLIKRDCKVGYLHFKAFYCVKIKGVKENGERILIRTCSVDNWGSICGDILFDQGSGQLEPITGCIASCKIDGCNAANHNLNQSHVTWIAVLIGVFNGLNVIGSLV